MGEWSTDALAVAAESGPLFINPIVYSEVSIRFTTVEALEDALRSRDDHIGAHAATAGLDLLTRDIGRYQTYVPTVSLVAPTR